MEPNLGQRFEQNQKLVLSPQIRQYLRLLQLPAAELQQAVDTEIEQNPLLEEVRPVVEEAPPNPDNDGERPRSPEEIRVGETFDHFDQMDENFQDNFGDLDGAMDDPKDSQSRKNFQETLITRPEALYDYLLWQIRFLNLDEAEMKAAHEIIGNIDDDGYLKATPAEISTGCGQPIAVAERALRRIQDLDPPGIAARNLTEALALQLRKKITEVDKLPHQEPWAQRHHLELALRIVTEQLPLLEKKDWPALSRVLNLPIEEIKAAAAIITRLEPKPGRTFFAQDSIAVIPDVTVNFEEDEDEEKLKIEVHHEHIPELRLNGYYRRLLKDRATDEKAKAFVREKMEAALNFMKALQLRKSTLRAITEELGRAQPDFFEKGFAALKPLRLKDVSSKLGIHESTVSRALHGKYILTPQGMIPFKSFFSTRLETTDGQDESQKSIMEKIRYMVHQEDPANPLSDQ